MHTPHVRSGGRYPVLRALAILYLIGAAVMALVAVIGAVWSLASAGSAWLPMGTSPNATDRMIGAVVLLAGGFFAAVSMLAIAEVLKLFIDIEHNSRLTAVAAMQRVATAPAEPAVVATGADGGARAANRLDELDEETAEAALLRGH